jgi:dTDP-4-amino-4,6-dideoxygalactose transaminase
MSIPDGLLKYPVMKTDLNLDAKLVKYLEEIQNSGTYSNFGPQVTALEHEYSRLLGVGAANIVSCCNATVGLIGAMETLNSESWLIPSWTFAATGHAARSASSSVIFGDVDLVTWMLEPEGSKSANGAVVTSPFGSKIEIGSEWNVFSSLVIDAAASIAAPPVISSEVKVPWAAVYSLHATKILGIGEGAILVFSTPELAQNFRAWTNFGFSGGGRDSLIRATNGKLSEVHGAIGRHRLAIWNNEKEMWKKSRKLVHSAADDLGLNPSFSNEDWISPYWIVNFKSADEKKEAVKLLHANGFDTRNWWQSGCHVMPAFTEIPILNSLDKTIEIASKSLGLPFNKNIEAEVVSRIHAILSDVID